MKLTFKKNDATDVVVTMFKGTAETPFSYIEMIKGLLAKEPLDSEFDESITEEEQKQIKEVLAEIEAIAKEEKPAEAAPEQGDSDEMES